MRYGRFLRQLGWKDAIRYGDYFRLREGELAHRSLRDLNPERVLDVGCSGTVFPQYLATLFSRARVYGVDNSLFVELRPDELSRESRRLSVADRTRFLSADGRRLPFADDTMDLVTSISVIEHLEGDADSELMREIARVLRPGGSFLLTFPMAPELTEIPSSPYCAYFMRFYDAESVRSRLIEPSGLEPIAAHAFNWRIWQAHGPFGRLRVRHEAYRRSGSRRRWLTWPLMTLTPVASRLFLRDWPVREEADYREAGGAALLLHKA